MPLSERSPLLEDDEEPRYDRPLLNRFLHVMLDGPSWTQSFRWFLFGSWLNILLFFVPLSVVSHHLNWDAGARFALSSIAILSLTGLLRNAMTQLSLKLDWLAGLLEASSGNIVGITVGIAAVHRGEYRIAHSLALGSILHNMLFAMGTSFLLSGYVYSESDFPVTAAQTASSVLTLAGITFVIPDICHLLTVYFNHDRILMPIHLLSSPFSSSEGQLSSPTTDETHAGILNVSRGTAVALLFVYAAFLLFRFRTHVRLFESPYYFREDEDVPEPAKMNGSSAALGLLLFTFVTFLCADYLVASIHETVERYHIAKAFLVTILLPFVTYGAVDVAAMRAAMKGRMEVSLASTVEGSIQIATFLIPLLVIQGWITGHDLYFEGFENVMVFLSLVLTNMILLDGKSNYMNGVTLLVLYFVIGLAFWSW